MGDKVEKTCPLCAEEMDLTDQQLKPCKCGYEICVWCWHHIMDMAERDNTEGRCPACRKPYDKEKIVGMTANCERLVAKINSEKKLKSQKLKSKTHEGRKHLSSIRVIQRNLVYVIGIPSNLADEDFLQRKEYFGQYGKVLKVSISRTAGGAIQHSSNNTCSVYITYSKEEEAVRCIQSVHDYILEGRSLRACFGTTKYCHAWLRNTPCTNPDCLYLHDIGTQEDSFTKDEIVSAYTRSRIPQINGAANNLHRRSGNVLPPPVDDICNSGTSSGISIVRSAFNNVVSQEKGSSPLGNSGRSVTLPAGASWGLHATNGRPPTAPPACSNEPVKQNPDALSEQSDVIHPNGGLGVPEHYADGDGCTSTVYESKDVVQDAASSTVNVINQLSGLRASEDIDDGIKFLSNPTNSIEIDRQSHNSTSDKNDVVLMNGNIQILCAGLSSLHMDSHVFVPSNANDCNDPTINHYLSGSPRNQVLEQFHPQYASEPLSSLEMKTTALDDACISREIPEWVLEPQMQGSKGEVVEDFLTLGEQNLKGSETSHDPLHLPHTSNSFQMRNHSGGFSLQHSNSYAFSNQGSHDLLPAGREIVGPLLPFTSSNSLLSYGNGENKISNHSELDKISEHVNAFSRAEKDKCLGKLNEDLAAFEGHTGVDMGESTIISNILSLDFDPWDEPLASPHYLAKIFSENDRQHGSLKLSGSRKLQNSDQSRFSFARQENFVNQGNDFNLSSNVGIMNKYHSHQDYVQNGDVVLNKPQNGFFSNISEGSDIFPSSNSVFSSNKLSVSRGQISAPPGFSVPVRAPPPGFSATERMDESFSVNQLLENSLFRSQYQMQLNGDQDAGIDVELIDPAILAVGRGRVPSEMNNSSFDMRSTFNSQLCASENERRLQLLMQQSISGQQNHRYFENIGDMFSPLTDPYNADSRFMEQSPFAQLSLQSRNLHTLNGWDGWHDVQRGNDLVMSEILRNEGFALNKNFPGYEGLKFQMSSSGSLYNSAFGM